jgi:hypothetical protein
MEKIRVKDRIMFEWFKKTGESNPRTKLDNIAQAIGYTYIGAFAAAKGGGVVDASVPNRLFVDTVAKLDQAGRAAVSNVIGFHAMMMMDMMLWKGEDTAEKQSNAEAPQDTAASVDPETLVEPELRDAFREQMNGIRSETS